MLKLQQGNFKEPYDWDEYAQVYFPKAEELVAEAENAEKDGNQEKASELYLYAKVGVSSAAWNANTA